MKLILLAVLFCGLSLFAKAQADCVVQNKIVVRDYDRNIVKNVRLEIYTVDKAGNKTFAFSPQKVENEVSYFVSTMGWFRPAGGKSFYFSDNYRLKVSAENFKDHERSIKFDRCQAQELDVILERVDQKIKLTGVVYDHQGSIIIGAKVKAFNKKGEIVENVTDENGIYLLNLSPDFYTIEFEKAGFKKLFVQNYQLVNSTYGKVNYDLVLEVGGTSSPIFIEEIKPIESPQKEISNKILQRPLEPLPKAQNKTKRKTKNN